MDWNEDVSYEDEIDWRSEHERAGDSSAIALIEIALEICHTADTDVEEQDER